MEVGDLVRCADGADLSVSGVGLVIEIIRNSSIALNVRVQWERESLWYSRKDLEVINECR